jgi:hypothetical protein
MRTREYIVVLNEPGIVRAVQSEFGAIVGISCDRLNEPIEYPQGRRWNGPLEPTI